MLNQTMLIPESVGIRSSALLKFFEDTEKEHLELHSFILARGDNLILECYRAPFGPDKIQRICSAGKALVALAVMFLIQEGKADLEETMYDVFPEAAGCEAAKKMTLRHVLTMHAGHREDSYGAMFSVENHMEGFFNLPFIDEPGTAFFYDNGIPDVLAEIVLRRTGDRIKEYLQPRLFDPLGITDVRVEELETQNNLPTFCIKTMDLYKITKLLYHEGEWNGNQILRPDLARAACSWQASTNNSFPDPGYGFQIWRNSYGGYFLNGGCGQFGICFPFLDLVAAMHSDDPRSGRTIELFWNNIKDNIYSYPIEPDAQSFERLKAKLDEYSMCPDGLSEKINFPSGEYVLEKPLCALRSFSLEDTGGILSARLNTENGSMDLSLPFGRWQPCRINLCFPEQSDPSEHRKFVHGVRLDTNVGYDVNEGYVTARRADKETIEIWFRSDAWMGSHVLKFCSKENKTAVFWENGISYNIRNTNPEFLDEASKACVYQDYSEGQLSL